MTHQTLTKSQALPFAPPQASLLARVATTLRHLRTEARERAELAALSDRELRDMSASSADVWHEIRRPYWRTTQPY